LSPPPGWPRECEVWFTLPSGAYWATPAWDEGFARVPLWWAIVPLAGLGVTLHFVQRPKGSTRPACRACGYDLAGNSSGRCPECLEAVSGRSTSGRRSVTLTRFLLIVLWHWTVLPGAQGLLARVPGLGEGERHWLTPPRFTVMSVVDYLLLPACSAALTIILCVGGWLGWAVFRWAAPRHERVVGRYVDVWWRACLWGIPAMAGVCAATAIVSRDRATALESVALWAVVAPVLVFLVQTKALRVFGKSQTRDAERV